MLKIWSFLAQHLFKEKPLNITLSISQLKKEGEAINQTEIKSIQVRRARIASLDCYNGEGGGGTVRRATPAQSPLTASPLPAAAVGL